MASKEFIMSEKCPGCKDNFSSENKPPILLICGHSFCSDCIRKMSDRKCISCKIIFPNDWPFPINGAMITIDREIAQSGVNKEDKNRYNSRIESFKSWIKSLNATFNKQLEYIMRKIVDGGHDLIDFESVISLFNIASRSQSRYTNEYYSANPYEMFFISLSDYNFCNVRVKRKLTDIPPPPPPPGTPKNMKDFKFSDEMYLNAMALLRNNAFVGSEVKGKLMWGRVTKVCDTILLGALSSSKEPPLDTTLVQFKWFTQWINKCKTVYIEFELSKSELGAIKKKISYFPESFVVYIRLHPLFMDEPLARQFYYLCTGEKGSTYINSQAKVKNNVVRVDDDRQRDIISDIPDATEGTWSADHAFITGSRLSEEYSSFYIMLAQRKLKADQPYIGSVYSGIGYFHNNMKLRIKDCGTVVFPNDEYGNSSRIEYKKSAESKFPDKLKRTGDPKSTDKPKKIGKSRRV